MLERFFNVESVYLGLTYALFCRFKLKSFSRLNLVFSTTRKEMDELYAASRPRINAGMLSKFIGKYVTMMGTVDPTKISSDGNSFQLSTGDRFVEVVMSTPLNELLDDIVEVTGKVDNNCHLQCIVYRKLTSSVQFNFEEYNSTLELIHKFPNCYSYSA